MCFFVSWQAQIDDFADLVNGECASGIQEVMFLCHAGIFRSGIAADRYISFVQKQFDLLGKYISEGLHLLSECCACHQHAWHGFNECVFDKAMAFQQSGRSHRATWLDNCRQTPELPMPTV